jgi:cell division septal protein FtsQ
VRPSQSGTVSPPFNFRIQITLDKGIKMKLDKEELKQRLEILKNMSRKPTKKEVELFLAPSRKRTDKELESYAMVEDDFGLSEEAKQRMAKK